jgi:dephospho-CoA kinase
MIKVLVTGAIGSGKTTFSRLLARTDWLYISADELVRELYAENPELVDGIAVAVDADIKHNDGNSIDTAKLASLIFQSQAKREVVEGIVHPEVQKLLDLKIAESSAPVLIYENAVVRTIEATLDFDIVIKVDSNPVVRMSRLVAKGMPADDAENRISVQAAEEFVIADAWLILNDGSVEDLATLAESCRQRIMAEAK